MAYKVMGTTASPFYSDMMIYYIMCDTPADLPSTISDIGYGTIIGYGSRADIISDSSKYIWNGSQWVRQTTGGGGGASSADQVSYDNTDSGLTATNVQDAIDELKDNDDAQDRALAELYGEDANQQLEINYAINTGSKNLFKIREPFTNTRNNVTFVVNADGTVDVSTTSDGASAQTDLTIGTVDTYEGVTYKLTGCPSGVTERCACGTGGTGSVIDTGSGALLTPTADGSRSPFIRVYNGAVITTPVKFYPMIRLAEIKSNTFEPYAPTNRELYETKLSAEDVWGYGQLIPDNTDLNDYTTGGKYYGGNSAGSTVLNLPVANDTFTFTLEVKQATPSMTYQYLRVCRVADDPYIYCRRRYNSWGSWYRFTGETVVASTQSVSPSLMLNREEITPLETDEIEETE